MVYVFLADGFEEVEALTPVDYLRRCGVTVRTVGVQGKTVQGSHGIPVLADATMHEVDMAVCQMIVLPGGVPGTPNLAASQLLADIIQECVERELPIGAICAAPSILGDRGLLAGRRATCANGWEEHLAGAVYTGAPVEEDGIYITSRGAGTANQFAFALARRLCGEDAEKTLRTKVRFDA